MSNIPSKGTALVTGASSGIGAVYADRLAKRGYDLILVARSEARLKSLSERLTKETGQSARAVRANLNDKADLAKVEGTLRDDPTIAMLVNNAGTASITPLLNSDAASLLPSADEVMESQNWAPAPVRFVHVAPWPGYKAGACNLALRSYTDPRAQIIGLIDADDIVQAHYLRETVSYFSDPRIGFVQSFEGNRDFEGSAYYTACVDSYQAFYMSSMSSRND